MYVYRNLTRRQIVPDVKTLSLLKARKISYVREAEHVFMSMCGQAMLTARPFKLDNKFDSILS